MRSHVLRNNVASIVEFGPSTSEQGVWYLKAYLGKERQAVIDYPIFISSYLIIINFVLSEKKQRISLPIAKDSLVSDDFRKLKFIFKTSN